MFNVVTGATWQSAAEGNTWRAAPVGLSWVAHKKGCRMMYSGFRVDGTIPKRWFII